MARTLMRNYMRSSLIAKANETVRPNREGRALDAAYAKAAAAVAALIEAKFAPRDMAILKRYGLANVEQIDFKIQLDTGRVIKFAFSNDDQPLTPDHYRQRNVMYVADAAKSKAIAAWEGARDAFDKEKAKRIAAYTQLVRSSKYADEIVAVWPEAQDILPAPGSAVMRVLDPASIKIINKDRAEQSKD